MTERFEILIRRTEKRELYRTLELYHRTKEIMRRADIARGKIVETKEVTKNV